MFNPLSSPFDALYKEVADRVAKKTGNESSVPPYGIKNLLDRRIIVLQLEYLTKSQRNISGPIEAWLYCEPGYFYEVWKIQIAAEKDAKPESIRRDQRERIHKLLNGEEIPSENGEYFLRLSGALSKK
jgi:hypothetical protein